MSLSSKSICIEQIKADYGLHEKDTGSSSVQIAILTHRIKGLTEHLKVNSHDFHSRSGMLKMVSRRKKLLKYLRARDITAFRELVAKLGLRAS